MLQLSRADVERLAVSLLDLGQQITTALRAVVSMQRSLERVRHSDALSPEGSLLLQEMARQVLRRVDAVAVLRRPRDVDEADQVLLAARDRDDEKDK